jgi:hypothetical protein
LVYLNHTYEKGMPQHDTTSARSPRFISRLAKEQGDDVRGGQENKPQPGMTGQGSSGNLGNG